MLVVLSVSVVGVGCRLSGSNTCRLGASFGK